MFNSILVVCTGNICRSPIGERLLRQQLPDAQVSSAGIIGLEGRPADATAKAVALRHGVSLEGHVARKVTRYLLQKSDLILVMEPEHLRFIASVAPENRGKSLLFGQWLETKDIPDPYRKSREAFEYVFEQLGKASQEWARRLRQQGMKQ
ncbi:protein tyrosine phosphatase [Enterobacter bugandensis]|uniref:arsenate reductase/protein-tyrosine-phosphatase family protein n=1 Tax=Enterobacter bugandensis TaxID=881260 RepID=UPI0007B3F3D3|nr:protein tyrosine phosphatase [Enterobacter bugandensis]KZP66103.1 protein tyrosine phosphatase [Enterobacter bugandensis]QCE23114.1 protein tyrosine phosphatase [Enterobacter bugandensis]THE54346.1 protein tyrosine phosphatase [Enterobacter bugandensis]HAS1472392.1 protein tyrosine phosphatase [Enterobacter bugandensis]